MFALLLPIKTWLLKISAYNVLSIGFPLYLVVFESVIRLLFDVEIISFLGPSLAAGGLGLLIEAVKPKSVDPTSVGLAGLQLPAGYVLRSKKEEIRTILVWIFVLVGIICWMYSCVFGLKDSSKGTKVVEVITRQDIEHTYFLSGSFICGFFNYLVGGIFSAKK